MQCFPLSERNRCILSWIMRDSTFTIKCQVRRLKRAFKMENNEKRSNEIINSVESHQWIFNLYMKTWGKSDFPWWWLSSNRWLDNFKRENTHFQIKYPATNSFTRKTKVLSLTVGQLVTMHFPPIHLGTKHELTLSCQNI